MMAYSTKFYMGKYVVTNIAIKASRDYVYRSRRACVRYTVGSPAYMRGEINISYKSILYLDSTLSWQ